MNHANALLDNQQAKFPKDRRRKFEHFTFYKKKPISNKKKSKKNKHHSIKKPTKIKNIFLNFLDKNNDQIIKKKKKKHTFYVLCLIMPSTVISILVIFIISLCLLD